MSSIRTLPVADDTPGTGHDQSMREAGRLIAPTWPLDQLIAVNPWWELRSLPFAEAAARLAGLGAVHCLMPGSYYAARLQGDVSSRHLLRAAEEVGTDTDIPRMLQELHHEVQVEHWHNISDLLDQEQEHRHTLAWRDEITHQISQFCAATFQEYGPLTSPVDRTARLYRRWHEVIEKDRGVEVLMGQPGLSNQFQRLPEDPLRLVQAAEEELGIPDGLSPQYFHALLLDINGWASWVAYLRWQDRLAGREGHLMDQLGAIRLAWELALWRHYRAKADTTTFSQISRHWRNQLEGWSQILKAQRASQHASWICQRACELAYQDRLQGALAGRPPSLTQTPSLQAVFCIDVRSEIIRRAIESLDPGIVTAGFAGFFGLPVEYHPAATGLSRPQLPGLLRPTLRVEGQPAHAGTRGKRQQGMNWRARWKDLFEAPPAMFTLVETLGLMESWTLIRNTFLPGRHTHPVNDLVMTENLSLVRDGHAVDEQEQGRLCAGILKAMGLTGDFAPTVLLVGHGSRTTNNPHAAGLDCGACGGQTGEVNVRVLAQMLNDIRVREALQSHGISIPEGTRFFAALHNTTTQEIRLLSDGTVDKRVSAWLDEASMIARRESAVKLGLEGMDDRALSIETNRRADDWSEVRPEWGLAGNAAFVIAPRSWTRGVDLEGRCFLQDYHWRDDAGFSNLELILTAPMLVTHWINMQYYASVVDNLKYGSGNKVLHNVVGGHLGVFEGNGGDLRIGLPIQSLHDGQKWMHEPLRLSVYVAAPREPIEAIVARHETVRHLIDNEWLFFFRLDDIGGPPERLYRGSWTPTA